MFNILMLITIITLLIFQYVTIESDKGLIAIFFITILLIVNLSIGLTLNHVSFSGLYISIFVRYLDDPTSFEEKYPEFYQKITNGWNIYFTDAKEKEAKKEMKKEPKKLEKV